MALLDRRRRDGTLAFILALSALSSVPTAAWSQQTAAPSTLLRPADMGKLPRPPADYQLAYGDDPNQIGELRVPPTPGPHPVVVLVHGGCWRAEAARYLAAMGEALKSDGIATWNIEYRRLGQSGGGWPGTYLDVGSAIDHLRLLATPYKLDLNRVLVLGHSAGGHLAMWAGTRQRIAASGPLFIANPLPIRGVINLAGTIDMSANIAHMEEKCRAPVVTSMLGGTPTAVPERYAKVSANTMLPLGIPQILIWGEYEDFVPRPLAEQYIGTATRAGDSARLVLVPAAGHFETASPFTPAWAIVREAIRSLLFN
jgi:acetyl esterase/lipase